jgi:hypothetical protein
MKPKVLSLVIVRLTDSIVIPKKSTMSLSMRVALWPENDEKECRHALAFGASSFLRSRVMESDLPTSRTG